jgi:hypothetical protein
MEILTAVLNDLLILMTLVVGGAVAVSAFLWLATFSRSEVLMVGGSWLVGGMICIFIYFLLALRFSLSSPVMVLLSTLIAGPLQILLPYLIVPSRKPFRRWIPYVVWLYFWVTVLFGWRYGWLGLLTITLPALLIAGLGLFFVAGFLLPFPKQDLYRGERPVPAAGSLPTLRQEILDAFDLLRRSENEEVRKQRFEQRRKALRCLLTYTLGTNGSYYVVIDEKISERTGGTRAWLTEDEKLIKRVDNSPFRGFLVGPGIVLTGCDHAVALSTAFKFKRVKGPGVILFDASERPQQVVDLRVQLRAFPVEAWTKDGIAVKVTTFIPFQIGTGKEKPALGKGFPYRASDVFKAVRAQPMEHVDLSQVQENLKQHAWYDLPGLAGERIIREVISRYEFDELYAPFELHADLDQDPRSKIAQKLRDELDKVLPGWGIRRIGAGIGNIEPVDERVREQRIEAWRADWARKIMLKQAAGQSRRLRLVEQARVQAQVDIILAVGERIERLRTAGAPIPMDAIARYFIELLEELAGRSALRQLLPGDMDRVMQRARGVAGKRAAGVEGG